jgi:hypothetical protein
MCEKGVATTGIYPDLGIILVKKPFRRPKIGYESGEVRIRGAASPQSNEACAPGYVNSFGP